MEKIISSLVAGGFVGITYSFIALALIFIYKSTKVLNLAHGWQICLFAYLGVVLSKWMIPFLPFPVVAVIVLAVAAVFGVLVERFLMRPLIGEPILSTIIVTLAISFILQGIVLMISKGFPETMPSLLPEGSWKLGAATIPKGVAVSSAFILLTFLACGAFYKWTKTGIVLRAVAEDSVVAGSMGVSVKGAFRVSWIVGCMLSAACGFMLASLYYTVSPEFSLFGLSKGLPVILLGGLESILGSLIGGIIVGIAEAFATGYIDEFVGGGISEVVAFVLMLLILLFRPYGIFGEKRIERV